MEAEIVLSSSFVGDAVAGHTLGRQGLEVSVLNRSSMDGLNSADPTQKWFWIIKYLSSFQQVPVGVLYDVIKETPPLPDDLRSKFDEVVALRILEEICTVGSEQPSASTSSADLGGKKEGFDLSETCHDVLECIMEEASISDIMARRKPLQRDIRPFVLHKRASMPKIALQQMLSRKQPVKDQGGPSVARNNHDGVCIQHPSRTKSIPTLASILNYDLKGGSNKRDSLPGDMELSQIAEEFKEAILNPLETGRSVLPDGGALGCEGVVESVEGYGFNLSNYQTSAAVDQGTESSALTRRLINGSGNEASPGVANDSDTLNHGSIVLEGDSVVGSRLPMKRQLGSNPDLIPNAKKLKRSPLDDPSEPKEDTIECNTEFDLDMDVEQVKEKEPSSCRDANQDLEADIIMKRIEFSRLKEQNVCVKCKEGGQLFVCRSKTCPFVVHERCVGFDEGGNFHCSFCSYYDAIKEYCKVVKEASSLQKDVAKFTCTSFEVDPEEGVLEDEVTDPEGTSLGPEEDSSVGRCLLPMKRQLGNSPDSENFAENLHQGHTRDDPVLVPDAKKLRRSPHDALEHKEDSVNCNVIDLEADEEHLKEKEPSSYGDVDLEIDVTMKKIDFLSSIYPDIGASSSKGYRAEQIVCVKCKQGGELLVCRAENCHVTVHEKCLGISAGASDFYCPFCSSSTAEKGCRVVVNVASSIRGDVAPFVNYGFGVDPNSICGEARNLSGNEDKEEAQVEPPEQHPVVSVGDGANEEHVGEAAIIYSEEKKGDEASPAVDALSEDVDKTKGYSKDELPEKEVSPETPHASMQLQTEADEAKTPKEGGKSTPWRQRLIEFGISILMAGLEGNRTGRKWCRR